MARPRWTIEDLLSRPRLHPYLAASAGDPAAALRLYGWNSEISGAFYESLHYVEIGLRNAMDRQLARWAGQIGARQPWYVDRRVSLTPTSRRSIADARQNATRGGQVELPGKVIAELTFGFWWSLLAAAYKRLLDVAERISPVLRGRIGSTSRVPSLLEAVGRRTF